MNLSLLTGLEPFLPLPVFGICSKADCCQRGLLKHSMPDRAGVANKTMQTSGSAGPRPYAWADQHVRTSTQSV